MDIKALIANAVGALHSGQRYVGEFQCKQKAEVVAVVLGHIHTFRVCFFTTDQRLSRKSKTSFDNNASTTLNLIAPKIF